MKLFIFFKVCVEVLVDVSAEGDTSSFSYSYKSILNALTFFPH